MTGSGTDLQPDLKLLLIYRVNFHLCKLERRIRLSGCPLTKNAALVGILGKLLEVGNQLWSGGS
jgi:hypothetical protein